MYLEHFGLREAPFRITPHTEFFFSGANRGATLEALIYAITHDEGIVKVSGEVGSGKTMLCRMLLEKLPATVETAYLASPSLSRDDILRAIAEELQIELPERRGRVLRRALQDRLLDIYAAGRKVVVMIDEAHAMAPETLEEIRLLSNLESNRHKLLHIVLFGQPELNQHLSAMNMRPLKERITHNFALGPLHRTDIGNYLMFRLRAAGYRGADLFTPRAIRLISRASLGLTRRINILADKALLAAFAEDRHQVDGKQVKAAICDAQFNPMRAGQPRYGQWLSAAAVVAVIAGTAYVAGSYRPHAAMASAELPIAAEPIATASAALPEVKAPEATRVAATPAPAVATDSASTFAERLAASEAWLKTRPDSHYFIQLLSTEGNNQRGIEIFLENNALDAQQLRIYRSRLSGRDRLGVIYGDYPSIEAASAELQKVARVSPASNPYIRTFSKLR